MRKLYHAIRKHKTAGVAILISDKQTSRQRVFPEIKRDTSQWQKFKLLGRHNYPFYVLNKRASKYSKQKLAEWQGKQTFHNLRKFWELPAINTTTIQKFTKDTNDPNYIIGCLDLVINIYETLNLTHRIYTLLDVHIVHSPRQFIC